MSVFNDDKYAIRKMNTLSGAVSPFKLFLSPSEKGSTIRKKEFEANSFLSVHTSFTIGLHVPGK